MNPEILKIYGHKIRVRICGFCWQNDHLLLVNHKGITAGNFWAPPGGGLDFGLSVTDCLKKEFLEETGLEISIGKFLFGCEFVQKPLHSIELFFNVMAVGGKLKKGDDPELAIIDEVRFLSPIEIGKIPPGNLHGLFRLVQRAGDVEKLSGFFTL